MEVTVRNHQKKISLNIPQIIRITTRILKVQGIKRVSLALVFVTSQKIRAMNIKYLHQHCSTDVLAFEGEDICLPQKLISNKNKIFTGDIVISTDAVIQNSRIFKTTFAEELVLYIIHGVLHLLGFDDHKTSDIKKMRKKEQEILALLAPHIKAVIQ